MVFRNPSRSKIRCVQVDGCLTFPGKKCDFLLIEPSDYEHFIELKGADVRGAATQLRATIVAISRDALRAAKHCFVVSTTCPLLTTEIQNLKKEFKKGFQAELIIKNKLCEHSLGC